MTVVPASPRSTATRAAQRPGALLERLGAVCAPLEAAVVGDGERARRRPSSSATVIEIRLGARPAAWSSASRISW